MMILQSIPDAVGSRYGTCGPAFLQSASVRGPSDNARAESFFHSLKAELTRGVAFPTESALRRALTQYLRYYNERRLHSALGYRSPVAFERQAA